MSDTSSQSTPSGSKTARRGSGTTTSSSVSAPIIESIRQRHADAVAGHLPGMRLTTYEVGLLLGRIPPPKPAPEPFFVVGKVVEIACTHCGQRLVPGEHCAHFALRADGLLQGVLGFDE